jgi:hypothetical protein
MLLHIYFTNMAVYIRVWKMYKVWGEQERMCVFAEYKLLSHTQTHNFNVA